MSEPVIVKKKLADFLVRNIFGHEPCHDFNPTLMGGRLTNMNARLEELKKISATGNLRGGTVYQDLDEDNITDTNIEKYVNMEEDSTSDILNTSVLLEEGPMEISSEEEEEEEEEDS